MKEIIHLLSHLAHFFLEWKMFQIRIVEKIEPYILFSVNFFRKSCRLWANVEKYCWTGHATGNRKYGAYALHASYLSL